MDISDFRRRDIDLAGAKKPVLVTGDYGPAVIVVHEIYGFTSSLARFCRWVRDAGFRVYAPILFGEPNTHNDEVTRIVRTIEMCVSREFTLFVSNRRSPITDWLRRLAQVAHEECGGPGVGAIGMCLTGGFALSMAIDPIVLAPVLAEPSLPALNPAALDIAPDELKCVRSRLRENGLEVRGYRFEGDKLCRQARFDTLQRELGDLFIGKVLPDSAGNPAGMKSEGKPPHSVFTRDLIDAEGEPTREAANDVIEFFKKTLFSQTA